MLCYEREISEHALGKDELCKTVYLFILWFLNQGSIAVDEKQFSLFH